MRDNEKLPVSTSYPIETFINGELCLKVMSSDPESDLQAIRELLSERRNNHQLK